VGCSVPDPVRLRRDLEAAALTSRCPGWAARELLEKLVELHLNGVVTTMHALLQLLVACYYARLGYRVYVEKPVNGASCDLVVPELELAVEVETGFIPPRYALKPRTYLVGRIVAKLARCAREYPLQAIAYPSYIVIPIPKPLTKPPSSRTVDDNELLYKLASLVSSTIRRSDITRLNLVAVMRVDVDSAEVKAIPLNPDPPKTPKP
jgi:hypothetical protein